MTLSRSYRNRFVGALVTASFIVVLLTAGTVGRVLWPEWRERTIEQAVNESREPEFWWPKSWRMELARRQEQRKLEELKQELARIQAAYAAALREREAAMRQAEEDLERLRYEFQELARKPKSTLWDAAW